MNYGLVGRRLGHSHSPRIHALLGGYAYGLIALEPEEVEGFFADREFSGVNVTIPYKETALKCCDIVSPQAQSIGSVNTVVNRFGVLYGYNTDYDGFLALADRAGADLGGRVLVLGSGGAGKMAARAVEDRGGASVFVSRSGEVNYQNVYSQACDGVINTTPVGMYPGNAESPLDLSRLKGVKWVLDLVYNPLRTALVLQARDLGLAAQGGLYMLVAQAAAAAELFTRSSLKPGLGEEVYRRVRGQVENVILIGMPGSGKTTVGSLAAKAMGREFLDTDHMIEGAEGMKVAEIFALHGEQAFRRMERAAVAMACKQSGIVLAVGGGAPMDKANQAAMRQNGVIYCIERGLDRLETQGRPLSANREALKALYEKRAPVYAALADAVVYNEGPPQGLAASIVEDFSGRPEQRTVGGYAE